jgi:uncharacterized membrane protein YgcG
VSPSPHLFFVAGVAPTVREAIQSAAARVAASAEKNPHVPPEFDVPMHEAGTSRFPVRHDFNRGWLSTAIAYSKERKYDRLSIVPHSQDQKSRYQLYTYHVGACIFLCQGPRHNQDSINMVESQCAILHCSDSAQKVVVNFFAEDGRDPLKSELFGLLEQQSLGSVSGDLTVCKKLDQLHCDDLAKILQARMVKGQVVVDLPSVLNLAKSELKLRPVPFDTASHVLWILAFFKDTSGGNNINFDLAAIRKTARYCLSNDEVKVEQMDPLGMLRSVASYSVAWDSYYSTVLSGPSGGGGSTPNSGGGGSSGGQFSRPSKRPFTPADQTAGRIANRQPAGGGAARQPFDPFVTIPNQCHMDKSDVNKKWFVRGQSGEVMSYLMKEGKCVLCKQSGHLMASCPTRQAMFSAK